MPNQNAELLKNVSARPTDLKFGAIGTRPSTAVEAGQSRTAAASDTEDGWLGREHLDGSNSWLKVVLAKS